MISILLGVHMVTAVSIVVLVLLQQGKGADMGAAFGGGGSQTLFGSRGSANFLTRVTALLVVVFFFTSMSLAWLHTQRTEPGSVTEQAQPVTGPETGDVPEAPGDEGTAVPSVPGDADGNGAGQTPRVPE